jgi:hypothetical protein
MFMLPYNYILVGCSLPYANFNHHQFLNCKFFKALISCIFRWFTFISKALVVLLSMFLYVLKYELLMFQVLVVIHSRNPNN